MQIKTKIKYLIPVKMTITKIKKIGVGQDVEKVEHLYTAGGNVKW